MKYRKIKGGKEINKKKVEKLGKNGEKMNN